MDILLGYSSLTNTIQNIKLERTILRNSKSFISHLAPLPQQSQPADRFYPVRVYDGQGVLKYTLDEKKVLQHAKDTLNASKHWTKGRYKQKTK